MLTVLVEASVRPVVGLTIRLLKGQKEQVLIPATLLAALNGRA